MKCVLFKRPRVDDFVVFLYHLMVITCFFISPSFAEVIAELEPIEVISTSPLSTSSIDANQVPSRVQAINATEIEKGNYTSITDVLQSQFGGVTSNAAQNNPLQADLQVRGFTASPLLGLPIGLAIYQDGQRINEPLGETVHWDLVPTDAVERMELISGANPIFGLNALGGALVLKMKDGFSFDQKQLAMSYGSFQRSKLSLQAGGNENGFAYYINAKRFKEDGWRDLSDSDAHSFYGNLAYNKADLYAKLSLQKTNSDLIGNSVSPVELLEQDYAAIFTAPDSTENNLTAVGLESDYWLNDDFQLSLNGYYRKLKADAFNGDMADDDDEGDDDDEDEDEHDSLYDAVNNISGRDQESYGLTLQSTLFDDFISRQNQFTFGLAFFQGDSRFKAKVQQAGLDPETRSTTTAGATIGPYTDDHTDIETTNQSASLFASDTWSLTPQLSLTAAARYDRTRIELNDQTGEQPELNGKHQFHLFNPSLGASYQFSPQFNFYASVSQSARAPSAIELACSEAVLELAGEDEECRLPNAFLADPPLKEVVARNFELGIRGNWNEMTSYHLVLFHSTNKNDIIFQSTGRATGLFKNIDKTRRMGLEAGLKLVFSRLETNINYSYLKATFEDDFFVLSPNHPAAISANGDASADSIRVKPGDRIPGLPEHTLQVHSRLSVSDNFSFAVEWLASAGQYLRGDESNELSKTPGYNVFNFKADYALNEQLHLLAKVENVFDKEYYSFALLGEEPDEVVGLEELSDNRFYGPASPRGVWLGLRTIF